ncbi:MFS transporter [Parafrankia sp. EUN1f]|uniref:MFS transporter n=1 Tax=Parafrankia sp. EUN1f TaxID=102897 RepID=UPI001E614EE7|nr:MFS transporter [Parafrankia sp. EUN1f]
MTPAVMPAAAAAVPAAAAAVPAATGASLVVLATAAAAFSIAQTAVVPGVGVLTDALSTTPANVAWVFSAYLVAAAILTPVIGRLGDMYGRRRFLIVALAVFTVGSVLSALAGNIWLLVAARTVQGAGGGIFPLCFGLIGEAFPEHRRPGAIGLIAAIAGIGAGVGLLAGGLLLDHASWRWIFWLGALMSAAAAVGALLLPSSASSRSPGRVDVPGALLLSVGLTAPLIALTQTSAWGWGSPRTLGLMAAGLAVLALFVLFELRTADPLVDVRLLVRPIVLATNFATLLVGCAMFGAFVLVPQIAQAPRSVGYGFGLDATGTGLLLLPASLAMLVTGSYAGRVSGWLGQRTPLMGGFLTAAGGMALLAVGHGEQAVVAALTTVVFTGVGLGMSVVPNIIVESVPAQATGQATGVNALVRSVGAALGSQVVATLLASSTSAGHPLPTDGAFTRAFWIAAGAAICASCAAVLIPRRGGRDQR